ncbi:hypothetical protein ICA16_05485, partial [Pseudomonas anatoliensis]|uniref:Ig-like domain-containing protein n=1 Tax=Pseudomonas anatoliensis TaxID=2710589 RepID=UPI001E4458AB
DNLLGSVEVDGKGNWSFTPSPLNNGEHSFTVINEDKAGNVGARSDAYVVIVDTVAPHKPTIDTVYDDQGPIKGNLYPGAVTDDTKPTISGKAEANSTVVIYDKTKQIGSVMADNSGNWKFTPKSDLITGGHSLTAFSKDEAGNVSGVSKSFDFTVSKFYSGSEWFGHDETIPVFAQRVFGSGLEVKVVSGRSYVGSNSIAGHKGALLVTKNSESEFRLPGVAESLHIEYGMLHTTPATIRIIGVGGATLKYSTLSVTDNGFSVFDYKVPIGKRIIGFDIVAGDEPLNDNGFLLEKVTWGGSSISSISSNEIVRDALTDIASGEHILQSASTEKNVESSHGEHDISVRAVAENQSASMTKVVFDDDQMQKLTLEDMLDAATKNLLVDDGHMQFLVGKGECENIQLKDLLPEGAELSDWDSMGEIKVAGVVYDVYQHQGLDAELIFQHEIASALI